MKIPYIVFVGTYPPRECGIATFTQDLLNSSKSILNGGIECKVAAMNVSPLDKHVYPVEVGWEIDQNNKKQHIDLAKKLNSDDRCIGLIVEHEYGIYGGEWGENILYLIERCKKPIVATFHTALPTPDEKMFEVTQKIIQHVKAIVVLTESSKKVLEKLYLESVGKIQVIPHGIHPTKFTTTANSKKKLKLGDFKILSTFGLLSRSKGIEYVIKALPAVVKKHPKVRYLILGKTHPVVRRKEGESYRMELTKLVTKLNLKNHVKFYDQYLHIKELLEFLKATDIYISTSINTDQAVSGTLSYALGTGRATVSTEFAQAKEIISKEVGRLVPIKDSVAMSEALNEIMMDDKELLLMNKRAYEMTRPMLWDNVALRCIKLLTQNVIPPLNLKHLIKMTDKFGLFQFADKEKPSPDFGYTIDDNARALIISNKLKINKLTEIYLEYIKKSQKENGGFVNYIGYKDKRPTLQNETEDLTDANARTLWALAEVMADNKNAKTIFENNWKNFDAREHKRAKAIMIKTLLLAIKQYPKHKNEMEEVVQKYADELTMAYDGKWFEKGLKYNNGVMPESLYLAGKYFQNERYTNVAEKSLGYLIENTFNNDAYHPTGNQTWLNKDGEGGDYDQQPEDPASMILALKTAYEITGCEKYKNLARICFSWFLGNNSKNVPIYNFETGGCYDGLTIKGVNKNQGAESLLSYLISVLIITEMEADENSKN